MPLHMLCLTKRECYTPQLTIQLVLQYREQLRCVQEEQQLAQNTTPRHSRQHVNQIAPINIHYEPWPNRQKLSEQRAHNRQCPQSKAWREFPDCWPYPSCTEVDLHSPILKSTLQSLCKVWDTQKGITSVETFHILELGGWKQLLRSFGPPFRALLVITWRRVGCRYMMR